MKTLFQPSFIKLSALSLCALAGTLMSVTQAQAGCGSFDGSTALSSIARWQDDNSDLKLQSANKGSDESTWRFNGDIGEWQTSIVGLWKFTFVAKGNAGIPDGAVIDAGYVTWHSDGTELMNSGRAPSTGSFCMGVWKQTAPATFKLNHYALSWDPTGTVLVGPTNIRENIKVDRRANTYSGTFTLIQFAPDGTTTLAKIGGTVSATRVTVD